ncbi:hypothetical protein GCM10009760_37520 [Kitasatospora kazusensis]|uniref:Uncharacterized protein n=1 Tax=Kitasatospora kazusensis TaxID=407974 RepID=A0ABN2ZT39_9ACTN
MYGAGAASYDRLGPRRRAWFPRAGHRSTQPEKSALPRHFMGRVVPCAGGLGVLVNGTADGGVVGVEGAITGGMPDFELI